MSENHYQNMIYPMPAVSNNDDVLLLERNPNLYVKLNTPKGRGVFTSAAIKKGEVIEVTPLLVFRDELEKGHIRATSLEGYT